MDGLNGVSGLNARASVEGENVSDIVYVTVGMRHHMTDCQYVRGNPGKLTSATQGSVSEIEQ